MGRRSRRRLRRPNRKDGEHAIADAVLSSLRRLDERPAGGRWGWSAPLPCGIGRDEGRCLFGIETGAGCQNRRRVTPSGRIGRRPTTAPTAVAILGAPRIPDRSRRGPMNLRRRPPRIARPAHSRGLATRRVRRPRADGAPLVTRPAAVAASRSCPAPCEARPNGRPPVRLAVPPALQSCPTGRGTNPIPMWIWSGPGRPTRRRRLGNRRRAIGHGNRLAVVRPMVRRHALRVPLHRWPCPSSSRRPGSLRIGCCLG
jgi:hypothetical protein